MVRWSIQCLDTQISIKGIPQVLLVRLSPNLLHYQYGLWYGLWHMHYFGSIPRTGWIDSWNGFLQWASISCIWTVVPMHKLLVIYTLLCGYTICRWNLALHKHWWLNWHPCPSGRLRRRNSRCIYIFCLALLWVFIMFTLMVDWLRSFDLVPGDPDPMHIMTNPISWNSANEIVSMLVIIVADSLLVSQANNTLNQNQAKQHGFLSDIPLLYCLWWQKMDIMDIGPFYSGRLRYPTHSSMLDW